MKKCIFLFSLVFCLACNAAQDGDDQADPAEGETYGAKAPMVDNVDKMLSNIERGATGDKADLEGGTGGGLAQQNAAFIDDMKKLDRKTKLINGRVCIAMGALSTCYIGWCVAVGFFIKWVAENV